MEHQRKVVAKLERAITPQLSSQIIDFLAKKRGWSLSRIAKRIGASTDYVNRLHREIQNFEYADVVLLAKACRMSTHVFVFEAMQPQKMSAPERELYDLTKELVESHKDFKRVMAHAGRKRRKSTKAA